MLFLTGCQQNNTPAPQLTPETAITHDEATPSGELAEINSQIEQKWGIQIQNLRLTAAGYMLDMRYLVTDPQKAVPIFDQKIKPYLVDQQSGAVMQVPSTPKAGTLRNTPEIPIKGKVYFVMFANPQRYIKSGNSVTVVIGDFKVEDLLVY